MATPNARRLLTVAAVAATLITLSACGDNAQPSPDPSESATAVIGEPSGEASPTDTATTATPTSTGTSGGGGGGGNSPYPGNAKDYGLAMLAAIKANDQTRIVDLANVNVYSNIITNENAQNRNGQWSHSHCDSQGCHYYNAPGNLAQVMIDTSKLGAAHAVTYVNIDGSQFPNDADGYLRSFINYWQNDSTVGKNAYAENAVVSFVNGRTKPTGIMTTVPVACGSGKTCIASGTELAGGAPFGQITCYTIQTDRLGKADAIVAARDGFCS